MLRDILTTVASLLAKPTEPATNPSGYGAVVFHPPGWTHAILQGPHALKAGHVFHDVEGFASWLLRETADPEKADVLVGGGSITAKLDNTRQASHRVTCELVETPAAKRWKMALGKPLTQSALMELLVAAEGDFAPFPGDDLDHGDRLRDALSLFSVATSGEYNHHIGRHGELAFEGGSSKREVKGSLPSSFELRLPWYLGVCTDHGAGEAWVLAMYDLKVLLRLDVKEPSKPTFTLVAPGLEELVHNARLDAADYLKHLLGPDFLVGLGVVHTKVVDDIPANQSHVGTEG